MDVEGQRDTHVKLLFLCIVKQINLYIAFTENYSHVLWHKYTNGNLEKDSLLLTNES